MQNKIIGPLAAAFLLLIVLFVTQGCSGGQQSADLQLTDYPDHESGIVKLYLAKCGVCHAAPLPKIHDATQWTAVVDRMQMRMTNKAMPPLGSYERGTIVEYLQKYAKK